ncbi:NADPH-dependent 1-acyl dihydroxyacetone phosphate reductase [Conoideocrella luteorostrata]|uniref:NADPH-dependent 1-acyl dihydroxyacetone phosphate reductase n=1 Tax=Conoideocrella luteorostrata TaxID=1105319 RepID=A0AAJ0CJR9_9HYPO|nr:NADPH-dependent 1-acyl dihydroxyacetone phosphate reductase [Conoideocrella luteorostrata]
MLSARKTVLITGCSPGGIGHALALEFHKQGCHVIATARQREALKALEELGMSAVQLEVTNAESIAACKAEVASITGGKLDILVNNAGVTHTIPALDIDIDDVRHSFEANVLGPMAMCQSFASLLIPARGLILQISSVSSVMPYLFASIYASTKGALNSYSRVLRMELQPFNVRVMVAMTGTVRSNIMNHFDRALPEDSLYKPVEDVFVQRLRFSQTKGTVDTHAYAEQIVKQALKGEGWLGGWFGRTPDWYWAGGFSYGAWIVSTLLPTRLAEAAVRWFFEVGVWSKRLQGDKED